LEVPDPIPHPEDISVNVVTGTIVIKGPMTPEEKVSWDRLWDRGRRARSRYRRSDDATEAGSI
jgi:hypothetical protein